VERVGERHRQREQRDGGDEGDAPGVSQRSWRVYWRVKIIHASGTMMAPACVASARKSFASSVVAPRYNP
jgi:hypothetical protein